MMQYPNGARRHTGGCWRRKKTGKRLRRLKGILLETKNNGLLINGHDARSKQTTVQLYGNRCS